jgi:hypothetical protein
MGYYVEITRAPDWHAAWEPHAGAISCDEWLAIARADPEMRVLPAGPMPLPGMPNFRVKHEGYEVWWTALPEINDEGVVWFTYVEPGFIQVKNPDEQILHKMHQIANQLNARLIGEEDEEYGEHGEVIKQPPHVASEQSQLKSKTWLQRLLGR